MLPLRPIGAIVNFMLEAEIMSFFVGHFRVFSKPPKGPKMSMYFLCAPEIILLRGSHLQYEPIWCMGLGCNSAISVKSGSVAPFITTINKR